tara:strand:- start:44 stop:415 length:372 start_codon:yes stop_codon:yes gene_type:complete
MLNEVNQNGKSAQDSYLKTKKKGNVTVNPKKEDLMSELYTKNLKNALAALQKEAVAATAANTTKKKEKTTTKQAPNANKDVQPDNPVACEEIDDTQAKKDIAERMRQRLLQLTQEHDNKYLSK